MRWPAQGPALRVRDVRAVQGSVTEAPLLDAAGWGEWRGCDAAVACEVVEHVHDPDAFAHSLLHALRCASASSCHRPMPTPVPPDSPPPLGACLIQGPLPLKARRDCRSPSVL